ncbi:VCBS repeat-containing protein [Microbispora sp. RL4-1S]|uniref:VCBS repeat-containing protein n=1 Tax=Microbispora oryzae TaxID=2806554 RepID=A0A940WKW9_9ACTN|nr:VCBS repeat-containing protein [Microbispora oryzae]MBP2702996.1 VCBS repeat-containing protein [Microbispora oryzae]
MNRWPAHMVKIGALLVILVVGWAAALPAVSSAAARQAAASFAFARLPLNAPSGGNTIRQVAPAYQNIRHWISSVGAGVALADLDGNGRSDDVCLVDPRNDSVTLRPAPQTRDRYAPIELTPAGLPYDATMAPMGCVPADYDDNGTTDVLVFYWGRSPVLFMRGTGPLAGPASFASRELVRPYQVWNTDALALADVDGDGRTDVIVGNYFPDGARVLDPKAAARPELRMQQSMSNAANGGTNRVLLSQGGGSFTEAAGAFTKEVADSWTLAIGAQDLDGDGLPELYIANDFGPDQLLRNRSRPGAVAFEVTHGPRGFTAPKSKVLGNDSFKGMGVAFTDLNGDDVPDMLVSNITQQYGLLESNFAWISDRKRVFDGHGTAFYDDDSEGLGLSRSGWGWDIKAGDFNGDGSAEIVQATGFLRGDVNRWANLQELAMTNDDLLANPAAWPYFQPDADISGENPNAFFTRLPDGRYADVGRAVGVADTGPSRGIATADVDHDGRLDFAVAIQWGQSYFYRNTRPARPPYLGLQPMRPAGGCATGTGDPSATPSGTRSGARSGALSPAIGASVRLNAGAQGLRTGQVYPANGHTGVASPELLFALRPGASSVPVEVTWRDTCGRSRTAGIDLQPGWHRLLLGNDGSIKALTEETP